MQKYLDPTNDSLFKKIFQDHERLKEFINSVLGLPEGYRIKEFEFVPVEQLPNIDGGKRRAFGLKVKNESDNWYIVVVQRRNESDYSKREHYAAHSYIQQLQQGVRHKDLLPVIVIALVKTRIFEDEVPYISFHKMIETKTNKQYLFDLSYVFIELGKFKKDQLASIRDEWLHLFKCAAKENNPSENIRSQKVLEAYNTIAMHNLTPEEYDLYIRTKLLEDAEEIALSENFEKGREEGIKKGIKEVAKSLLLEGVDIKVISKTTGLSIEEIEKLKE